MPFVDKLTQMTENEVVYDDGKSIIVMMKSQYIDSYYLFSEWEQSPKWFASFEGAVNEMNILKTSRIKGLKKKLKERKG